MLAQLAYGLIFALLSDVNFTIAPVTNLFGGNAGLISGIILAAVMATAFEGRNAKADAMLLASCVIAQGALAQMIGEQQRPFITDKLHDLERLAAIIAGRLSHRIVDLAHLVHGDTWYPKGA